MNNHRALSKAADATSVCGGKDSAAKMPFHSECFTQALRAGQYAVARQVAYELHIAAGSVRSTKPNDSGVVEKDQATNSTSTGLTGTTTAAPMVRHLEIPTRLSRAVGRLKLAWPSRQCNSQLQWLWTPLIRTALHDDTAEALVLATHWSKFDYYVSVIQQDFCARSITLAMIGTTGVLSSAAVYSLLRPQLNTTCIATLGVTMDSTFVHLQRAVPPPMYNDDVWEELVSACKHLVLECDNLVTHATNITIPSVTPTTTTATDSESLMPTAPQLTSDRS